MGAQMTQRIAALAAGAAVAVLVLSGCAPEAGARDRGESAGQRQAFPAV